MLATLEYADCLIFTKALHDSDVGTWMQLSYMNQDTARNCMAIDQYGLSVDKDSMGEAMLISPIAYGYYCEECQIGTSKNFQGIRDL